MATEVPTPEDKLRFDAARKELMQALTKRRIVDKQLVRFRPSLKTRTRIYCIVRS